MEKPLNAYLVYDKDLDNKQEYYELFYKLLCRNTEEPTAQSINMPIYVLTNTRESEVAFPDDDNNEKMAFVLVDVNMLYNKKNWKNFLEKMKRQIEDESSNIHYFPVALTELALGNSILGGIDFVCLEDLLKKNRTEFEIRICHFCLRSLLKKERLKVFISHSKRDDDKRGLLVAKTFREKIAAETKLEFYFDANNIQDGEYFEKSIEKDARRSLLLLLNSDTYSSREWCQREIIAARNNECPYVVVSLINNVSDRIFPYMGNAPCIRYNDNWDEVLLLLLKTATWNIYGKKYLDFIKEQVECKQLGEIATVMGVPDLFNVVGMCENTILYSLPPLMYSERTLLEKKFVDKKFITPIEINQLDLNGKRIALSVSEAIDAENFYCSKYLYDDLIVEIVKYILVNKGHVIYGGDLRKGGHTENIFKLISSYREFNKGEGNSFAVTNYLTNGSENTISKKDFVRYEQNGIQLVPVKIDEELYKIDGSGCKAIQLSSMRKERNNQTQVLIAAGGKINGFSGALPGILEEVILAIRSEKTIYLLGGFGGMTNRIANLHSKRNKDSFKKELLKDEEYAQFLTEINRKNGGVYDLDKICDEIINYENFNLGLEQKEKEIIATSHDVLNVINLLMKGLKNGCKA